METIQERFDRAPMGILTLERGEYEGPLILSRPCSVDGKGSLLWARHGPVVQVAAGPATLRNFRIEVSPQGPEPLENLAVAVVCGELRLEHVEVAGEVLGVPGEETGWRLPRLVAVGAFAAGTENRFTLELETPGEAELLWDLPGLSAVPGRLPPGKHRVTVKLPAMERGAALWTPLWVRSEVTRRIMLSGRALAGAARLEADSLAAGAPLATVLRPGGFTPPLRTAGASLVRGQRQALKGLAEEVLTLELAWGSPPPAEAILPYVFLLGAGDKVRGDEDLVSPQNPVHLSGAAWVTSEEGGPAAALRLSAVPERVEKLAVCFASGGSFSTVRDPVLRMLCREGELWRVPLDRLHRQNIVAAAELYRYRGEWRLNPVGMGYAGGLPKLCADFGMEAPPA